MTVQNFGSALETYFGPILRFTSVVYPVIKLQNIIVKTEPKSKYD